jgi:hypothetical protein
VTRVALVIGMHARSSPEGTGTMARQISSNCRYKVLFESNVHADRCLSVRPSLRSSITVRVKAALTIPHKISEV